MAKIKCIIEDKEFFIPLTEGINFHYEIAAGGVKQEGARSIDALKFFSVNDHNQKVLVDFFDQLRPFFIKATEKKLYLRLSYVTDGENVTDLGAVFETSETSYPDSIRYEVALQDDVLTYNLGIYIRNEV